MNFLSLLLSDSSPNFRILALKEIFERDDDDKEIRELHELRNKDPLVQALLSNQNHDGSWTRSDLVNSTHKSPIFLTAFALIRLSYLGYTYLDPPVHNAIEFLLSKQGKDGSWSLDRELRKYFREEDSNIATSLQTSIPLRGIVSCGFTDDPRVDHAFDWLIEQRLDDGSWPTGVVEGNLRRVGGYRKLAHSVWGCRSNTTSALACLVHHPQYRTTEITRKGLDLLLASKTLETHNLGFEIGKLIGIESNKGLLTFHYQHDLAFILRICAIAEVSKSDLRVQEILRTVNSVRSPNGLWRHPLSNQASRFLTFDLLHSISNITDNKNWFNLEPSTPFSNYPKVKDRY